MLRTSLQAALFAFPNHPRLTGRWSNDPSASDPAGSLANVAQHLGFSDQAHLTRLFTRLTDVTRVLTDGIQA